LKIEKCIYWFTFLLIKKEGLKNQALLGENMRMLFVSTSCSKKKYKEVYEMRNIELIEPQQKFCNLLIDGMSVNNDINIECLTAIPVSASTVNQKNFKEEIEIIAPNLKYHYLSFKNGKLTRYLTLYINSGKAIKKWIKNNNNEQQIIVCDALSYFITRPVQKIARKKKVKVIGIITDLPRLSTNMKGRKESYIKKIGLIVFQYLTEKSLSNYDAYIPLTKSINDYVNKDRKPVLIIEGSVDASEMYKNEKIIKKKIMLYAGGIYEKYGLKNLVEAFIKADTKGYQLHIYGEGSYVGELERIEEDHPQIKYMGMATLEDIIVKEKEAMILVNPRFSNEEFSKYSFPSKTLEYMSSGTPVLMTKLHGIPKEYFDYVFLFNKEDSNSMAHTLSEIFNCSYDELNKKGQLAFDFVMQKKNNIIQGKKMIHFFEKLH